MYAVQTGECCALCLFVCDLMVVRVNRAEGSESAPIPARWSVALTNRRHDLILGVHGDGQERRTIIFVDNSFHPREAAPAVLGDRRAAASTADHHCSGGHKVGDRILFDDGLRLG